jgi:iron complex outermembrane receptor protein
VLPAPVDPRINLNNQPWSQPSVFKALTGTVRFSQALNADWRWSAQIGQQRLKSDDRLAYAFGCGAEGNYDRYCSDGTFDVYDFRSENERRTQTAGSINLKGNVMTGSVRHELGFGLLQSRVRNRFENQAYNYAGTGNIWATAMVPPSPDATTPQTNRDERSTELSVQDAIRWNDRFTTWLGARHTRMDRSSIGNDGSNPTGYKQDVTTPWIAASYAIQPGLLAYASWGKGVESQVVPNRSDQYSNAGQALPALKSRQWELGIKGGNDAFNWQLAWFDIQRPMTNLDACNRLTSLRSEVRRPRRAPRPRSRRAVDRRPVAHRRQHDADGCQAPRQHRRARRNGQWPTNVPKQVLRAQAAYRVPIGAGSRSGGPAVARRASQRARRRLDHAALVDARRCGAALRHETARREHELDARHRQPVRPPLLEGIALPVRPRLPVPRRTSNAATGLERCAVKMHERKFFVQKFRGLEKAKKTTL